MTDPFNRINGDPAIVLLVEDDPGDQKLVRLAFEKSRGRTELHIVSSGEEAVDYLLRRARYQDPVTSPRPHLILLDLNMPKMDGRQFITRVRANPDIRHLVIVVFTTGGQEQEVLSAYSLGANSYIPKPLTFDGFVRIVHAIEDYWFRVTYLPPRDE